MESYSSCSAENKTWRTTTWSARDSAIENQQWQHRDMRGVSRLVHISTETITEWDLSLRLHYQRPLSTKQWFWRLYQCRQYHATMCRQTYLLHKRYTLFHTHTYMRRTVLHMTRSILVLHAKLHQVQEHAHHEEVAHDTVPEQADTVGAPRIEFGVDEKGGNLEQSDQIASLLHAQHKSQRRQWIWEVNRASNKKNTHSHFTVYPYARMCMSNRKNPRNPTKFVARNDRHGVVNKIYSQNIRIAELFVEAKCHSLRHWDHRNCRHTHILALVRDQKASKIRS